MGSVCDVAEEVIDYMNAHGEKVGLIKVRLYRPFCADRLVAALPKTAKKLPFLTEQKNPVLWANPFTLTLLLRLRLRA